jgi:hypothetical protein
MWRQIPILPNNMQITAWFPGYSYLIPIISGIFVSDPIIFPVGKKNGISVEMP